MNEAISFPFTILLFLVWFFLYWVLGGVFFAIIAILRLGRVRKVRFSCLFTMLALLCAAIGARFGMRLAENSISVCSIGAVGRVKTIIAIVGCGFSSFLIVFLLGAFVLTLGGFIIMYVSKPKTKPWIVLEEDQEEDKEGGKGEEEGKEQESQTPTSQFF